MSFTFKMTGKVARMSTAQDGRAIIGIQPYGPRMVEIPDGEEVDVHTVAIPLDATDCDVGSCTMGAMVEVEGYGTFAKFRGSFREFGREKKYEKVKHYLQATSLRLVNNKAKAS